MRDDVKQELFGDEKPKNSEIMVELGKRWKALSEEEQKVWNENMRRLRRLLVLKWVDKAGGRKYGKKPKKKLFLLFLF